VEFEKGKWGKYLGDFEHALKPVRFVKFEDKPALRHLVVSLR
jgi:hypothetical protein